VEDDVMQWVTREHPKIDRIACPWLIRRFIEPEAEFLYVPTDQVLAVAAKTGAKPYDIPGAEPFAHDDFTPTTSRSRSQHWHPVPRFAACAAIPQRRPTTGSR